MQTYIVTLWNRIIGDGWAYAIEEDEL